MPPAWGGDLWLAGRSWLRRRWIRIRTDAPRSCSPDRAAEGAWTGGGEPAI